MELVLNRGLGLVRAGGQGKTGRAGRARNVDVPRRIHRHGIDARRQRFREKRGFELRIQLQNEPLIQCIPAGDDQVALRVRHSGRGRHHLGKVQAREPAAVEIHFDDSCLLLPRGNQARQDEQVAAAIGGDGLWRAVGRIEKAKQNLVSG